MLLQSRKKFGTVFNGKILKNECPRTAFINGIDSNQRIQLAYNVFSNRFGSGYYYNNQLCAIFGNNQVCDAFRILAARFPGAEEYNSISQSTYNASRMTFIAYQKVHAVYNRNHSIIENYGPICENNESCDLFYDMKGDSISFKDNTTIEDLCFIVREN